MWNGLPVEQCGLTDNAWIAAEVRPPQRVTEDKDLHAGTVVVLGEEPAVQRLDAEHVTDSGVQLGAGNADWIAGREDRAVKAFDRTDGLERPAATLPVHHVVRVGRAPDRPILTGCGDRRVS